MRRLERGLVVGGEGMGQWGNRRMRESGNEGTGKDVEVEGDGNGSGEGR